MGNIHIFMISHRPSYRECALRSGALERLPVRESRGAETTEIGFLMEKKRKFYSMYSIFVVKTH